MNLRSIFVKIKFRHNISFLQNTHIKRKRGNRSFRNAQQRTKNQGGKDFAENGNQNREGKPPKKTLIT